MEIKVPTQCKDDLLLFLLYFSELSLHSFVSFPIIFLKLESGSCNMCMRDYSGKRGVNIQLPRKIKEKLA